jgi:2,4-didehydro-3-deoxy-L-rhamnonate hydrolase
VKFFRFGDPGRELPGIIGSDGVPRDISSACGDLGGHTLAPESLARLARMDLNSLPRVSGEHRLGCCVSGTRNFIAVGLNYADHAAESGAPVPVEPILFNKAPSCIAGPNDDIQIPRGSTRTDWEVELAIVIGVRASYLDEAEAASVIAGYCVCNDVSEREFQLERGGQWTKGKGCATFGPLGPWLVTPDEIADVQSLSMWLDVNGQPRQRGSTSTMIFRVHYLVSYISQFMTLEPGDVITTGTPPGVGMGMKPPRYLRPGDQITLGIEGLGQQRQRVVACQGSAGKGEIPT